jgi:hypothetical protein
MFTVALVKIAQNKPNKCLINEEIKKCGVRKGQGKMGRVISRYRTCFGE